MKKNNLYFKYTERYLNLLENFMNYITVHKTDLKLPSKANIIIFDAKDKELSEYSLRVLNHLMKKKEKNIVEVTKTGSKTVPWRISKSLTYRISS